MDPLVRLQVCPRGGDMHPAARLFFSSAPFFNVEGGDKHPAAHVFNPEQAHLERNTAG